MHSLVLDGKVLDFKYKKDKDNFRTLFYVGDIFVGQIFHESTGKWAVVGSGNNNFALYPIHGFATRWDASQFLLKAEGYIGKFT